MHAIAPRKKQAKTTFSANCISFDGRESKHAAIPIKPIAPEEYKSTTKLYFY